MTDIRAGQMGRAGIGRDRPGSRVHRAVVHTVFARGVRPMMDRDAERCQWIKLTPDQTAEAFRIAARGEYPTDDQAEHLVILAPVRWRPKARDEAAADWPSLPVASLTA
jgi:hypothetical protein